MHDGILERDAGLVLSDRDFQRLSELIYVRSGIVLSDAKKVMLQARLQKRLRSLRLASYKEYCDYLFSTQGLEEETAQLIDAVTTNKTDFFREPDHFAFLTRSVIPSLQEQQRLAGGHLNVWSTACSSGQEPYTLAMVLAEYVRTHPGLSFSVLGTDISGAVLRKAEQAVYREEDVVPVPEDLKRRYLLRSKDRSAGLVKIVPELRARVTLRRLNLMDASYGMEKPFEVIFCRNVIIYFDRPTQALLLRKLVQYLAPGGYLFLGHSESLNGTDLRLEVAAPTVYRIPIR